MPSIRYFLAIPALFTACLAAAAAIAGPGYPVATIGKQRISSQDLDSRLAGKLEQLQKNRDKTLAQLQVTYARERQNLTEQELNSLLDERVLSLEAAARGSTPEALLAGIKSAVISDAQVQEFYEKNKSQMDQPPEKMAPLIKDYLQKQDKEAAQRAFLTSLRTQHKVVVTLEPLREPVAAVGPQRGPDNAAVTVVEFSDFQCPFCGRFSPVIESVRAKYPTQVRLIYRHLPLSAMHPHAQHAAQAAVCAQGQGKFWEMHDLMFAQQSKLDDEGLKQMAQQLGLNTAQFAECLDSAKAREAVQQDADAAAQLSISGTPASFVNGRYLNGAVSAEELTALIEDELRRAGTAARR